MGQIWRADHHNPTTNIQIGKLNTSQKPVTDSNSTSLNCSLLQNFREACEWTQMFTCGRQHYKKCAKILKFAKKTRGNLFCLCWNFSLTPFIRGPQTPSPGVFLQPVAMFKGSHVFSVKSFFSIKHWSGFSEKCLASLSVLQHSKNK